MSIDLLVQLSFVFDPSGDSFVRVDDTEFQIRDVPLEEIPKVVSDS